MTPDDLNSGLLPSIENVIEEQRTADRQSNEPLQVGVHLGEVRPTNQPGSTPGGQPSEIPSRRSPQRMYFPLRHRYSSPERRFDCDGWCRYTPAVDLCQNVVSIRGPIEPDSNVG